jgi:hypothetical protein
MTMNESKKTQTQTVTLSLSRKAAYDLARLLDFADETPIADMVADEVSDQVGPGVVLTMTRRRAARIVDAMQHDASRVVPTITLRTHRAILKALTKAMG